MRKSLADRLIRVAHRVYPPEVATADRQMRVMLAEKQLADARAALDRDLHDFEQITTSWNPPTSYTVNCMDDATAAAVVERAMRRRDLTIQRGGGYGR